MHNLIIKMSNLIKYLLLKLIFYKQITNRNINLKKVSIYLNKNLHKKCIREVFKLKILIFKLIVELTDLAQI